MLGNVWEWTESWYDRYPASSYFSVNFGQTHKVVRGGSHRNDKNACRTAKRGRYKPEIYRPYLGFRIAHHTVPPPIDPTPDPDVEQLDLPTLRSKIIKHFNLSELHTLIFNLGWEHDDFPQKRPDMVLELLSRCKRRKRLSELLELLEKELPTVNWY